MNDSVEIITIHKFLKKVIKYWKLAVSTAFIIIVSGTIIGYFHANSLIKESKYGADLLKENIIEKQDSYKNKKLNIDLAIHNAEIYIKALEGLTYNGQPDIKEYLVDIENIQALIKKLRQNEQENINNCFEYNEILLNFSEVNFNEEKKWQISKLEKKILIAESNLQILNVVNIQSTGDNELFEIYEKILMQTKDIGEYRANLSRIKNFTIETLIDAKIVLNRYINEANSKVNYINLQINELSEKIAKEKNVRIVAKKNKNQFEVKVVHGYRRDTFESRFTASIIISSLFGVVIGIYLAGVKKESN